MKMLWQLPYWYLTLQPLQNQLRDFSIFVNLVQEKWHRSKLPSQAVLFCAEDMTLSQIGQNHLLFPFSFRTLRRASQPLLDKYFWTQCTSTFWLSPIVYVMRWMLHFTSSFNTFLPLKASAAASWLLWHSSIILDLSFAFTFKNQAN